MRIFTFLLCILFFANLSFAEQVAVQANLEFKPEQALGIILSSDGLSRTKQTEIQKQKNNLYQVNFDSNTGTEPKFHSAILTNGQGDIQYAPIQKRTSLNLDEPICKNTITEDFSKQLPVLTKLYEVRTQIKEIYRNKLANQLSTVTINNIYSLERNAGIIDNTLINSDTSPAELNQRLSRLLSISNP